MKPEIDVFIGALRAGKPSLDAFQEYCWAKSLVPIERRDLELRGDPSKCSPRLPFSMAPAMGADAFDAGCSDEQIASAFEAGLKIDAERDLAWRAMNKWERPTTEQLLRSMGSDAKMKAGEIFGFGAVAKMMVSR